MVIRPEELVILTGETEIRKEYVFLERAGNPSSEYGDGIPRGILRLTDRRLFFISTGVGRDIEVLNTKQSLLISGAKIAAGFFLPHGEKVFEVLNLAQDLSMYGIHRWKDKEVAEQMYQYLENEYSFVIPIKRIVSCEKFGSLFWLDQTKGFRKRYLKLGITNDEGFRIDYCVYCNHPREPDDATRIINHRKWFKEIKKLL